VGRTWSPIPLSDAYGRDRKLVLVGLSYTVPLFLLVVLGLWSGAPARSIKVYLLVPALYFTAAHAISVGSLRYRVPADVPMTVIAAMVRLGRRDGSRPNPHVTP
jgi:hypothetical protein